MSCFHGGIEVPDLCYIKFRDKLFVENLLWKFYGRFSMEFHVGINMKTSWRFHGISRGILCRISMENFSMVILREQKPTKTLWRPVVFYGNSMEYST